MILVLLGTQNNSFHRLLEEIQKNINNGTIKEKVVVQEGYTKFQSKDMEIHTQVPKDKLQELIKKADLIITHGGVGSIISAITEGKKVIAVPRLKKYNEHVNDHQLDIIDSFNEKRYIIDTSLLTAIPLELKGKIGYEDKKSIKLDEEMKSLKTKSISLTSSEEDMLEASENKGKSTEGKYSYSNFLEYQKEIDKEEIEI